MNFLRKIIENKELHIKWLNTLSYLENCGARKIAACEHPLFVREEMLKHAAEEFRHAHHLKKQIFKLTSSPPKDYSLPYLLGGWTTIHYLDRLEIAICRKYERKFAYSLVTYAIEKRAQALYPAYHALLKEFGSPISVTSIIHEEEEHLAEMETLIEKLSSCAVEMKAYVCHLENLFFLQLIHFLHV